MSKMVDRIRKALGMQVRIPGAAYTDEWWGDIPPATASIHGVELSQAGLDLSRLVQQPMDASPGRGETVAELRAIIQESLEFSESEEDWEAKLREAKAKAEAAGGPPVSRVVLNPAVPSGARLAVRAPAPAPKIEQKVEKKPEPKLERKPEPKLERKPEKKPDKALQAEREPTLRGIPTPVLSTPDWMASAPPPAKVEKPPVRTLVSVPLPRPAAKGPAAAVRAQPEEDWDALIRRAKANAAAAPKPKKDDDDWDALIRRAKAVG